MIHCLLENKLAQKTVVPYMIQTVCSALKFQSIQFALLQHLEQISTLCCSCNCLILFSTCMVLLYYLGESVASQSGQEVLIILYNFNFNLNIFSTTSSHQSNAGEFLTPPSTKTAKDVTLNPLRPPTLLN